MSHVLVVEALLYAALLEKIFLYRIRSNELESLTLVVKLKEIKLRVTFQTDHVQASKEYRFDRSFVSWSLQLCHHCIARRVKVIDCASTCTKYYRLVW